MSWGGVGVLLVGDRLLTRVWFEEDMGCLVAVEVRKVKTKG